MPKHLPLNGKAIIILEFCGEEKKNAFISQKIIHEDVQKCHSTFPITLSLGFRFSCWQNIWTVTK